MLFFGIQKGIFYKPNGVKLASYLESLGPIFTKFGQLLSTRTDILAVSYTHLTLPTRDVV